jgi:hypothetical protein
LAGQISADLTDVLTGNGDTARTHSGRGPNRGLPDVAAVAVLYDDLHVAPPGAIVGCRRVDAVDGDGRIYQLVRLYGEPHATVLVNDTPDPTTTTATQPALTCLRAALSAVLTSARAAAQDRRTHQLTRLPR